MSESNWQDKMQALAMKHYTPEQRAFLFDREDSPFERARINLAWVAIFNDIKALGAKADHKSREGQAIAKRAYALMDEFANSDPATIKAMVAMNRELAQDAALVARMPGQEHWPFIDRALVELRLLDPPR